MKRPGKSEHEVSERDAKLISAAIVALELGYESEVLAIVAQDSRGIYITLRPGCERQIAEHLYDCNWNAVFAAAIAEFEA